MKGEVQSQTKNILCPADDGAPFHVFIPAKVP